MTAMPPPASNIAIAWSDASHARGSDHGASRRARSRGGVGVTTPPGRSRLLTRTTSHLKKMARFPVSTS